VSAVTNVQTYLDAQAITGGVTGWTCVRRGTHDQADRMVTVTEDGGPTPELPSPSGVGDVAFVDRGVHLEVRGRARKSDESAAKALEIWAALHGLMGVTMGSTVYERVTALTAGPVFVAFDEIGRPIHTVAFVLAEQIGGA
jgi:hypothetical protein